MKTLSNIIPNPLNINKLLNSNYSTSRFATSDFNGKENTEIIKNYKTNIASNKISESGEEYYIGGIGEIGLVMQNISQINDKIKEYKGTEIPLDGKYVSSTLYNEQDFASKEYEVGNANNVWYYDISYGMINHGPLTNTYRKFPLYKYDIKDFDSTEDDFDEYDNNELYIGNTINNFNIINYLYYCQDDTLDDLQNTLTYNFFINENVDNINENLNNLSINENIVKYPVYSKIYDGKEIYSFPLLPSAKKDNYYDCEFYIIIPEFKRYINNRTTLKQTYNIDLIYKNIKVAIKFGNGEIKEILEPFIRLNDAVIYKFHKKWLYDYMFINNQEIIISLIDYGTEKQEDQVLISKKMFFNIFKIMVYQGKYQNQNFRFKYSNYYPLKYPLSTKKKFLEINYVPYNDIQNIEENQIRNVEIDSENISNKDPYIILNDIYNNYAYLNNYIYHNYNEGNNLMEWFLKENGNGLMIDQDPFDSLYSYFQFGIENPIKNNEMDNTIVCYCKTFSNYDRDGILDSLTDINEINYTDHIDENNNIEIRNFNNFNVYGLKQLIYIPYKFNNIYGEYVNTIIDENTIINDISIFEDYLFIFNNTADDIKLYFTDESMTLCENTRIITIKSNSYNYYKPSKHNDYNIILKNSILNKYKLEHYMLYKYYIDEEGKIDNDLFMEMKRDLLNMQSLGLDLNQEDSSFLKYYNVNLLSESDNNEIVKIPIYDYSIPLFGNIVVIQNL